MSVFFCLFALILLYYFIENRRNKACLASFKAVIHVNGIRGKTSTCRYIDAALRTRYRVFTKTTGTDAMFIDVSGAESPVRRFGPANIHEQLRTIRRAGKEGAEILVLECMAVNPKLQKIAQEQIVRSGITVITNVRYDHIFEMGSSLEEIAGSLAATVPEDGTLYTAEPEAESYFGEVCRKRNCRLVSCPSTGTEDENIGIARAVSASLGITPEEFESSLSAVKKDFGARRIYTIPIDGGGEFHFLNLFSANDPQSTGSNVREIRGRWQRICFLYNHREDRPDRALLFAQHFFPDFKDCTVFLTGKGAALPKRLFSRAGVSDLRICRGYEDSLSLPPGTLLVGIGNIKGEGYKMIKYLEERGADHE